MQDKRLGGASKKGSVYSCGVARVNIPFGADRDTFINECYLRGEISIQQEYNGSINRVRVDKSVMQQIRFPTLKDGDNLGSIVVYVNIPKWKFPVVVACLDSVKEYGTLKENQFNLHKRTDFGSVSILGDGKGQLSVSVNSEVDKQGFMDININNPDDTAKLNINVRGQANITTSDKISVLSNKEIDAKVDDGEDSSYINVKSNQITQISEKIVHNEGNEQMVLGNTLLDKVDSLISNVDSIAQECSKIVVPTALGPSGIPVNSASFISISSELNTLKGTLKEFLSSKSNIE